MSNDISGLAKMFLSEGGGVHLEVPWFKPLCKYTVWEALIIFPSLLDPESVVTGTSAC